MSIHAFDVCTLRYWVTQNNKKNRIKRSLLTRRSSPVHRPSSLCLLNVYDLYNRLTRELLVGGGCSFSLLMAHKRMLLDTQSQKPILSVPKEGHPVYNKIYLWNLLRSEINIFTGKYFWNCSFVLQRGTMAILFLTTTKKHHNTW